MPIQVIIKRKWQTDKHDELIPLLTKLRSRANKQAGYISGETLMRSSLHLIGMGKNTSRRKE